MTDNEIINALQCCIRNDLKECKICPYDKLGQGCRGVLRYDILDLINRQKTEIEKLEELNDRFGNDIDVKLKLIYELQDKLSSVKVEAIKEFAERLTNKIFSCDVIGDRDNIGYIASDIHSIIDNLVEEMTEE